MAMHEPYTWIVSSKTNGQPTAGRYSSSVPLDGVDEIEVARILVWVIVSEALADDKEIVAMEMERMALCPKNASALHHHFDGRVERKHHHLCSIAHRAYRGAVRIDTGVIERNQRLLGKVSGVYTVGLPEVVGLQDGCGW